MSINLPGTAAFPTNVVAPVDGELVTGASVQAVASALADRTQYLKTRDAVGDKLFMAQTNNGATVSASTAFTMSKDVLISTSVPNGAGGFTAATVWVAPTTPWILEGIALQITGTCTSDATPATVELTVKFRSVKALICDMSSFAGGTTYTVDGTTTNKTIFGAKVAERGALLTQPYTASGQDVTGFALDETNLAAISLGTLSTTGLCGANLTLNVTHGSASARSLSIPTRIYVWGRLL